MGREEGRRISTDRTILYILYNQWKISMRIPCIGSTVFSRVLQIASNQSGFTYSDLTYLCSSVSMNTEAPHKKHCIYERFNPWYANKLNHSKLIEKSKKSVSGHGFDPSQSSANPPPPKKKKIWGSRQRLRLLRGKNRTITLGMSSGRIRGRGYEALPRLLLGQ